MRREVSAEVLAEKVRGGRQGFMPKPPRQVLGEARRTFHNSLPPAAWCWGPRADGRRARGTTQELGARFQEGSDGSDACERRWKREDTFSGVGH